MAKYLRDISIQLKYNRDLIDVKTARKFNISTKTVQNIFWHLIPKSFEFGNILKLTIKICLSENDYEEPTNFDGYVTYNYVGFNFEEYFNQTRIEQNKRILNVLREIIHKIPVENRENKRTALGITK